MDKHKTAKTVLALDASVLKTFLGTVLGTAALVGIHHRYRKQRQPQARLQDYLLGINAKLKFSPTSQLTRLRYAYRQAASAYQHCPQDSFNNKDSHNTNNSDDLAALHTTMLSRPVSWVSGVASLPKNSSLPSDDNENSFGVVGIDADRQIVWQTTMPERVHDIVVQPFLKNKNCDVVVMGRRPSEGFWVLDTATGQVQYAIKAAVNRHFYGHACYSLDGTQLYVSENDTVTLNGKIGIYDAINGYQKINEFDSCGIGPHELIMHPDSEILIVANGGIKTEQASREELNLDSMRPSLVYLNRHDGTLLEQIVPEHSQMSIRHLAIHNEGTVMIGIQFQGERHINVPLVLTHQRGDAELRPLIMPNNQWQRFHQYIASVAVDSRHNLLCVTTPMGGCAAIYDLTTRKLIDEVRLPDCAGASVLINEHTCKQDNSTITEPNASANDESYSDNVSPRFMVSDGLGQLTILSVNGSLLNASATDKPASQIIKNSQLHKMCFDNHLQAL